MRSVSMVAAFHQIHVLVTKLAESFHCFSVQPVLSRYANGDSVLLCREVLIGYILFINVLLNLEPISPVAITVVDDENDGKPFVLPRLKIRHLDPAGNCHLVPESSQRIGGLDLEENLPTFNFSIVAIG